MSFLTRKPSLVGTTRVRPPWDKHNLYEELVKEKQIVLDVYGKRIEPFCNDNYSLRNINSISLKYPPEVYYIDNGTDRTSFAVNTAAHWQRIGSGPEQYWVCSSTVNRGEAGDIIICFEDYLLWQAFDNMKVKEPDC